MTDRATEFTFAGQALAMRPYGGVFKACCPICGSRDTFGAWKIPMTRLDPPMTLFGGYFNQVPTLQSPFEVFGFDFCRGCESVFLNPDIPREQHIRAYIDSTSYIPKMAKPEEWRGYEERYADTKRFAPAGAKVLVDAGCGYGQILFLAQRDKAAGWQRAVGLELSAGYVKNMREHGIEAHQFDLDRDDHRPIVPPGSADIVSFFEAFEHVERPLGTLARLLDMLRPGGRLYFTAQRYGADVKLAIRPGEPIYIGPKVVEAMPRLLPCTLHDVALNGSRYFIVLERTAAPVTEAMLRLGEPSEAAAAALAEPATPGRLALRLSPPFEKELGHAHVARLRNLPQAAALAAMADSSEAPRRSRLRLLENGRELGPAHAAHARIRAEGSGAYSHWGSELYFSSSDGTDPNTNGRRYELLVEED